MRLYEVMVILDVSVEDTEINAALDRATALINNKGGSSGRVERWGRRTFAYELKHRTEGYYVLIEFSAEPTFIAELDRQLTLEDVVLRHKVVLQPDKESGRALRANAKRAEAAAAKAAKAAARAAAAEAAAATPAS